MMTMDEYSSHDEVCRSFPSTNYYLQLNKNKQIWMKLEENIKLP